MQLNYVRSVAFRLSGSIERTKTRLNSSIALTYSKSAGATPLRQNLSYHHQSRRLQTRAASSNVMSPSAAPPLSKELNFADYDIVGFDLDGTLLRYNLNEMVPLEYELLRRFLVDQRGYSRALLDQTLDWDFLQKGLILDTERGNILKLSGDATIMRASHGTTPLTKQQIEAIYGAERKWTITTQFFKEPLSTWNGPLSAKLRTLLDYFDVAVSLVFAQTVQVLDAEAKAKGCSPPATYNVWPDILEALLQMYTRENFDNGRSAYFEALRAQPDRYLLRTSAPVLRWLQDLRAAGKALFLLTGSNIDFAHLTASYALGAEWQQLFDCVVCFAKKPGFFAMERPFLRVNGLAEVPNSELELTSTLPLNAVYTQGNWPQLRATLAQQVGKPADKVRSLYVGDNFIQDVYAPVQQHALDSIAVCEELLADKSMGDYKFRQAVTSSFWGSYHSLDNKPTLWTTIITKYSQLCIPLIDTLAEKPITHRFQCGNAVGYYPKAPTNDKLA